MKMKIYNINSRIMMKKTKKINDLEKIYYKNKKYAPNILAGSQSWKELEIRLAFVGA